MLGCLALCCAFRLHVFAAFLYDFERLAWLICSILQCMALHDGSCHTTLTTTSSMAPRTQALSRFGSMYRVRGIQSPKTPWGLPRRTQTRIGSGAKYEVYWPRESTGGTNMGAVSQPVSYASFYTWHYRDWVTRGYQRLGRPHPSIARPVCASGSPDLMYAGLTSSSASSNSDGG